MPAIAPPPPQILTSLSPQSSPTRALSHHSPPTRVALPPLLANHGLGWDGLGSVWGARARAVVFELLCCGVGAAWCRGEWSEAGVTATLAQALGGAGEALDAPPWFDRWKRQHRTDPYCRRAVEELAPCTTGRSASGAPLAHAVHHAGVGRPPLGPCWLTNGGRPAPAC